MSKSVAEGIGGGDRSGSGHAYLGPEDRGPDVICPAEGETVTRPIVFATDFSPISDAAMPHALELARLWDAPLRLVHVIEADAHGGRWLGLSEALDADVGERVVNLLNMRRDQVADSGVTVELVNRRGVPADEILEELKTVNARAVVLGSHGYGGFRALFVGSVATRVVRGADCPALMVPPKSPPPPWAGILYPTDFSALSRESFHVAVRLAANADSVLEIFHVEIPPSSAMMAYGLDHTLVYELETDRELLDVRLGELSALSRHKGVATTTARVLGHGPGRLIVDRAKSEGYDLIVMPANGRRGFERFLFGSVTEAVMRRTDRPVMVLPGQTDDSTHAKPVLSAA
ncbi:MAG: nucleotide-binding universal stress UspA family protein [Myxococcota bacterium]